MFKKLKIQKILHQRLDAIVWSDNTCTKLRFSDRMSRIQHFSVSDWLQSLA